MFGSPDRFGKAAVCVIPQLPHATTGRAGSCFYSMTVILRGYSRGEAFIRGNLTLTLHGTGREPEPCCWFGL
jgi:hypothetical protein